MAGTDTFGLAFAWRPDSRAVRLGAGRMAEAFLYARAEGAFGGLSSSLDLVRVEAGHDAGRDAEATVFAGLRVGL